MDEWNPLGFFVTKSALNLLNLTIAHTMSMQYYQLAKSKPMPQWPFRRKKWQTRVGPKSAMTYTGGAAVLVLVVVWSIYTVPLAGSKKQKERDWVVELKRDRDWARWVPLWAAASSRPLWRGRCLLLPSFSITSFLDIFFIHTTKYLYICSLTFLF